MIKQIAFTLITSLVLVGCGGGDSTDSGSKITTQDTTVKDYNLWDYMVPLQSGSNTFSLTSNGVSSSYTSTYQVNGDSVEEVLDYAQNEKTIYQKESDRITVKFENDGKANGTYDLVLSADVGDIITKRSSSCTLSNHHTSFSIAGKSFQDVIEIRCNNLPGYYQKGVGEIAQVEDSKGENLRVLSN